NSSEENFYAWIKNSQNVVKSGDSYANQLFKKWNNSVMTPQAVSNQDIDDIFAYVETVEAPVADNAAGGAAGGAAEEESSTLIWWIIGVLLIVVIGAASTVRGQLNRVAKAEAGEQLNDKETLSQGARRWAW